MLRMTFPKPVVVFFPPPRCNGATAPSSRSSEVLALLSPRPLDIHTKSPPSPSQRCCSRRHLFSKQFFPWEYFISLSVMHSSHSGLLLSTYVATVQRLVCQTRQEWLINCDWHLFNTAKISVWHSWKAQCKQHLHKNSFASLRRTTLAACAKTVFQNVRMC